MNVLKQTLGTVLLVLLIVLAARSDERTEYYELETIETPEAIKGRVDGLSFSPGGTLFACFHQAGRVYRYDRGTASWDLFADGLHDPMGIHAASEKKVIVMQRAELTRITDPDSDGWAEEYRTLFDDFGMSGNFHELSYGPVVGPEGNYFVALSTADESAYFDEYRGEFRAAGSGPTKMRSNVPYRGWVFRVSPEGESTKWASGVRSPNGLTFDDQGRLFYTDNQGDWMGTNKLFRVKRGGFYGHGASLIWKDGYSKNPWEIPLRRLDRKRKRAAVQFPYGKLNGSITQPLQVDTGGAFGPFEGQYLMGDFNNNVIWRIMLEKVGGQLQGACVPFYQGENLRRGINRLVFGPDNALWIGLTGRDVASWSGTAGLQRLRWTETKPPAIRDMHLTEDGFTLSFTRPVDRSIASRPEPYSFTRYYYEYHREYGSDRYDETSVPVQSVEVSKGGKQVQLELEEVKPGYLYELHLNGLRTEDGTPLTDTFITYTVNRLVDGTPAPRQVPSTRPGTDGKGGSSRGPK